MRFPAGHLLAIVRSVVCRIRSFRWTKTTIAATMYFAFLSLDALVAYRARLPQPEFGFHLATYGFTILVLTFCPASAFGTQTGRFAKELGRPL